MDPLSITTAVVSLTGVALVIAKRISDLRTRFNVTSMTLTAILSETTVVSASLGQIQAALLRFSSTFVSQFEHHSTLLQTLDTALTGCSVVIFALREEVEKLEVGLLKATSDGSTDQVSSNWLFKMKILWEEDTMKELLVQVRNQQASLGFLLQLLNMNSMAELHNLMAKNSAMLSQLTENTSALRRTYSNIRAPRSIIEEDRDSCVGMLSRTASSAGTTKFDFDEFLVDSKVYRRAFMSNYLKPRGLTDAESSVITDTNIDKEELDVKTITDASNDEEIQDTDTVRDLKNEAEWETTMDAYSEYGSSEAQTNALDTGQWSPYLPEKYRVLRVKAVDGELVYMDTEMVEELLQQHDQLTKKCQQLQGQHDVLKRTSEIQNLKIKQADLQTRLLGAWMPVLRGEPNGQPMEDNVLQSGLPTFTTKATATAVESPTRAEFSSAIEVPVTSGIGIAV